MKNVIKTVLFQHQKFLNDFINGKLVISPIITKTVDNSEVLFFPDHNRFTYNNATGSYYFHGTNIVFMYIDSNRKLNVMQLPNEFFKILN
jgi:hypothetical protein